MLNACPKCSFELRLGNPGRGRYKLKCPKCATPLELTVFAEPGKPSIIAERAGSVDFPAEPQAVAIPGDVDDPSPARSSSRPEPNRDNLEATVASWIDADRSDVHTRPGATSTPAQPTLEMSSAFTPDAAGKQRGEATVEVGFDRGASATIAEPQGQPDSEAGFLVAAHQAAQPQNAEAAAIPLTFRGYTVVSELGRGGMGAVFLARQLSLDRNVALKVIAPRWARDPTFLARFTREAYAAAQLVHHNIVQIYDLGQEKEVNYFSMEFVDGQSLAELIQTAGALGPRWQPVMFSRPPADSRSRTTAA